MSDINAVKVNLEKKGYMVSVFDTKEQAAEYLAKQISPDETVGIGGSITVEQLGIYDVLTARGNTVFWHWKTPEDETAARKGSVAADVFLSSANAITEDGRMINIDGTGNRLAALLFGPGRVYIIAGENKLRGNFDDAMEYVKLSGCVQNARRLGLKLPCALTGKCVDCDSPQRFCRGTLILDRCMGSHPMEVILVRESLGY